jgi:hypothetical protein
MSFTSRIPTQSITSNKRHTSLLVVLVVLMGTSDCTCSGSEMILEVSCENTGADIPGTNDAVYKIRCPEGCTQGHIYGTNLYTDESRVCLAARHTGAIGPQGGLMFILIKGGSSRFKGSTQNDIPSGSWRFRWLRTFAIKPVYDPESETQPKTDEAKSES